MAYISTTPRSTQAKGDLFGYTLPETNSSLSPLKIMPKGNFIIQKGFLTDYIQLQGRDILQGGPLPVINGVITPLIGVK